MFIKSNKKRIKLADMETKTDQFNLSAISLDQWIMFVAVCETGGVHAAARALNRSHSAISHALKLLQETLDLALLQRRGRNIEPTTTGLALCHRAKQLIAQAQSLETLAKTLSMGWEAELRVIVDGVTPNALLIEALKRFEPISRGTRIRFIHAMRQLAAEAIHDPDNDLILTATLPSNTAPNPICTLHYAPVCGANSPLARAPISATTLEQATQIVIADASPPLAASERGWLRAAKRWSVPDMGRAKALVMAGHGFAILPVEELREELGRGELVSLAPSAQGLMMQLHLLTPKVSALGPAGQALFDALTQSGSDIDQA